MITDISSVNSTCQLCAGTGYIYNPDHRAWQMQWDTERRMWMTQHPGKNWCDSRQHAELLSHAATENIPCDCPSDDTNTNKGELLRTTWTALRIAAQTTETWISRGEADWNDSEGRIEALAAMEALCQVSAAAQYAAQRIAHFEFSRSSGR